MLTQHIELTEYEYGLCVEFAEQQSRSYLANSAPRSKSFTSHDPGRDYADIERPLTGRVAEYAACLYLNVNPITELNWSKYPDHGTDFVYAGIGVDMKASSHPAATRLIWPHDKITIYETTQFDALGFARVSGRQVMLMGFTHKIAFREYHRTVTRGDGTNMFPGTWYMDAGQLLPPGDFVETVWGGR